ncbi:uncharacterized protein BO97DRAFT_407885 [Aspergillus homomorphus CBS 101889]|uniref:Uncharacterized protein n=1 Tax=Aspergillus homomorphus (strain CBS 101889) TaxID=1450537 RepID=A0A395HPH5_ASPHC|nr:hypothetical protein BO97DRAFT_407885 [Aspergillus homomorphus CBS 101889]RAL09165.1 hypothetical protein BO97DRAFT_407885 [Aspergillus homomorphus CBS 101889]
MAGDGNQNCNQDPHSSSQNRLHDQHHHNHHHPHGWSEDDNPFVAIRRFADEQISSVLQSVTGLPSSTNAPSERLAILDDDARYRQRATEAGKDTSNVASGEAPHRSSPSQTTTDAQAQNNKYASRPRSDWEDPWAAAHHHFHHFPRNYRSDADFFFSDFFDQTWPSDPISSFFLHPYRGPLSYNLLNGASTGWPLPYLLWSPYSPLQLERQSSSYHGDRGVFSSLMTSLGRSSEEYDPAEPRWREAFEDLLRLENGKPMLEQDKNAVAKPESGKDWLLGLVKRGSLGDKWRLVSTPGTDGWPTIAFDSGSRVQGDSAVNNGGENAGEATLTEQDVYDRYYDDSVARNPESARRFQESSLLRLVLEDGRRFRDMVPREMRDEYDGSSGQQQQQQQASSQAEEQPVAPKTTPASVESPSLAANKTYVVSTQVQTQRVRLPDGSIKTKTVRTKRFSDGREETNESVDVVNPRQPAQGEQQQQQQQQEQSSDGSNQNKDGWFWKG